MAVGGRLVAALLAVSRLFNQIGLKDDDTWAFLDHMWDWLTVDAATFHAWHNWINPVLDMALGDPVPDQMLNGDSIPPDDFRGICEDVAELVYGNLFGAVQHGESLRDLERLRGRLARYGLDLPPAEVVRPSSVSDLAAVHGWGAKISREEVATLRALVW